MKARIAISADGRRLRRGSIVHCLRTITGGREWFLVERKVTHTRNGHVSFSENVGPMSTWTACWKLNGKWMCGDHRIYVNREKAERECQRRNAR